MRICGKGISEYRTALEQGRIKPGDNLFVQNKSLEHYIIEEKGLDWGNSMNKKKAKEQSLTDILSRKKWYVTL